MQCHPDMREFDPREYRVSSYFMENWIRTSRATALPDDHQRTDLQPATCSTHDAGRAMYESAGLKTARPLWAA